MNANNAVLDIYVDGSCAPKNPGGTPVWGCFFLRNGVPVDTLAGLAAAEASERATNNLAEYVAFINALKETKRRGWDSDRIRVLTDSQLLHGQLALGWKVRSQNLLALYEKAMRLKSTFPSITIEKIARERNKIAHRAARGAFFEARYPRKTR